MKKGLATFLIFGFLVMALSASGQEAVWWKGNTHSHSWWSDGDAPPEIVAAWYKEHGYHFLFLSDHNILLEGEKWYAVNNDAKKHALEAYKKQFGADGVVTREGEKGLEVQLKTLDAFQTRFNEEGRFLLIPGEEITDGFEGKPVHLNALNLKNLIPPQKGDSVRATIQNNVDAVLAQKMEVGRPMLVHTNHPNFGWGLTAADIARVENERFFEIYNGHPGVRNYGDAERFSTERMWDVILTQRLLEYSGSMLYGIAVDDAHNYWNWGVGNANPGRGWVMVRAARLDAASLLQAMEQGDFYSSTGVTLRDVRREGKVLSLEIEAEEGIEYTIQFIGTRKGQNPGAVFAEHKGNTGRYELQPDDLYVRAKVISNQAHPNPFHAGDLELAWTQPLLNQ